MEYPRCKTCMYWNIRMTSNGSYIGYGYCEAPVGEGDESGRAGKCGPAFGCVKHREARGQPAPDTYNVDAASDLGTH